MEVKNTDAVKRIASQVIGLFPLDDVQKKQIRDYAEYKAHEWINEEKHDWEIEAHIKNQINELTHSDILT